MVGTLLEGGGATGVVSLLLPPPPHDAKAKTAMLENKKDEGPFNSKRLFVPFDSFFRRSKNCFSSKFFKLRLISPIPYSLSTALIKLLKAFLTKEQLA